MNINIRAEYENALKTGWAYKVGQEDPSLTYQEFIYFWCLRTGLSMGDDMVIDPEELCRLNEEDMRIFWLKYPYHNDKPMEFNQDWTTIFATRQEKYAKEYENDLAEFDRINKN